MSGNEVNFQGFVVRHFIPPKPSYCLISDKLSEFDERFLCDLIPFEISTKKITDFFTKLCDVSTVTYYFHNNEFDPSAHFYGDHFFRCIQFKTSCVPFVTLIYT